MIGKQRRILPEESYFMMEEFKEMCQLAVKVDNKQVLEKILNNFKKGFVGLRLRTDGQFLLPAKDDLEIVRFPKDLTDCRDACETLYKDHSPSWKDRLATIGMNDQIIAISSNHLCCDGGLLLHNFLHCLDDDIGEPAELPWPICEAYKEDLARAQLSSIKLSHVDELTDMFLDPRNKPSEIPKRASFYDEITPVHEFQCYNSNTKKITGLTESIFSASCLTLSAIGDAIKKFGVCNCCEIRKYLKPGQLNLSCCNHFVCMKIVAHGIKHSNTIRDLNNAFREDLRRKQTDGTIFKTYLAPYDSKFPNKALINCSNVGPIRYKAPIKDFWMQSAMNKQALRGFFFLVSYSKISESENNIVTRLTVDQDTIPPPLAKMVNDSILYTLTKLPLDLKLLDAVKAIQRFQRKYK